MRLGTFAASVVATIGIGLAAWGCSPPPAPPKPPPAPAPPAKKAPPMPEPAPPAAPSSELETLLRSDPGMATWLDDATRRRIQILVAIPTDDGEGPTRLRRIGFRVDEEYFYPASAVKLCAAYGAAEKIEELAAEASRSVALGIKTPMRYVQGEGRSKRTIKTTLLRDFQRALVSSENDAYDRLFDFVGRNELAARMARMGLRSTRVVQHLGDGADSILPAIELLPPGGRSILVAQRLGFDLPQAPTSDEASLGKAHVDGNGKRVAGPMDFSEKNTVPLSELQDLLVAVGRPDLYDRDRLHLGKERRDELAAVLEMLPSQLKWNAKGTKTKLKALDTFHKPIHVAVPHAVPEHKVHVLEKGGRALGFAVENAYAVDETSGRSFFVTATIDANDDETLNDDAYEYGSVATPFFTKLGEVLARAFLVTPR